MIIKEGCVVVVVVVSSLVVGGCTQAERRKRRDTVRALSSCQLFRSGKEYEHFPSVVDP